MEIPTIRNVPAISPGSSMAAQSGLPGNLREACQEFESLFIQQMVASMRNTVPQSSLLGTGSGQRIFREMLVQELSRGIARAGGFGVADMLYSQLSAKETSASEKAAGSK